MNKDAEIEDFPLGCVVRTPTGSIGVVVKHRYASKIDLFARVDVQFSNNPRDGVVLQPKYLVLLGARTSKFNRKEFSDFLEFLHSVAADRGVVVYQDEVAA